MINRCYSRSNIKAIQAITPHIPLISSDNNPKDKALHSNKANTSQRRMKFVLPVFLLSLLVLSATSTDFNGKDVGNVREDFQEIILAHERRAAEEPTCVKEGPCDHVCSCCNSFCGINKICQKDTIINKLIAKTLCIKQKSGK